MRFLFIFFILFYSSFYSQKQQPFSGKLVYSIQICDTNLQNLIPKKQMVIYTNDTLLRIENETEQLGKQVIIKHMILNKSYLLLTTPFGNYAIQTDNNLEKTDTFPYRFKKKWGKEWICNLKANKLSVSHDNYSEKLEFLYFKNMSNKYINTLENFPGLPVKYYISTVDGIYLYQLISIEKSTPDFDLFGIPSDYKKVTFDQFMNEIMSFKKEDEDFPENRE